MKRLLIILMVLWASQAWGANHYFSAAGDDDTGDGSIGNPWKTITKANDQCSEDTCYFNRGDTFTGKLTFSPGTTYGAYGTGNKPIIQGSGSDFAGYCNSCNTITVQDIEFKNAAFTAVQVRSAYAALSAHTFQRCKFNVTGTVAYGSDIRGIHVDTNGYSASDFTIDSNEFTGMEVGFQVDTWGATSLIYDLTISNNNFHNIVGQGVKIYAAVGDASATSSPYGVDIDSNTFTTIGYQAIWIMGGLRYVEDHPNYIRNNVASEIGGAETDNVNAFQLNWIRYVTIDNNSITNVYTSAPDGCGIYPDIAFSSQSYRSSNLTVTHNIVTGCTAGDLGQSGGICAGSSSDSLYAYNILYGNGFGIDMSSSGSTGNTFYNNVMDGNYFGALFPQDLLGLGFAPASTWKDNIFSNNTLYGFYYTLGNTAPTEAYNIFYGNGSANIWAASLTYPNNGTFADTHDSEANSVYLGSKITLASDATISYIGANIVIFAQGNCRLALYNADGSSRLAYAAGAVSADGWLDVYVNYAATAGTYQIWANCDAAWKIKQNASDCTAPAAKKMWDTDGAYADPPPATHTQNTDNGCYAVRFAVMASQSVAASDITTDPMYKNRAAYDFRIRHASPAKNAGVAIAGLHDQAGCEDYAGDSCNTTTPSIGAYQDTVSGGGLFNSFNRFNKFAPSRRLH